MTRLDPKTSLVLVVDVQEKLARAMPEAMMKDLERAATVLIEAADTLGARVLCTEQYPSGLGSTLPIIAEPLGRIGAPVLSKMEFSACDAPGFAEAIAPISPESVIVVGMETHVCVYQTVRELCRRDLDVHVCIDGVASRREDHRAAGLGLCQAAGARLTTMETVVFDWLERAGTDAFRKLSKLIR